MPQPLTQLTPHLWVSQSELFDLNSGFFHSGDQVCLIDLGVFPAEIEALTGQVNRPEVNSRLLVLTHSDWDHLMGVAYFPGSRVIVQANYQAEVGGQAGRAIYRQVEQLTAKYKINRPQPFAIPQPQETFTERLALRLGDLDLELIHAPGHAADHLAIYAPEDETLWAGDMLSDAQIPYVLHNLAAYETTLAKLAGLEIAVLVPGHGRVTTNSAEIQARIAADRAYLAALREQVSQAVAEGLSAAETVAACRGFTHPVLEANAGAHKLNMESVYLELGDSADPGQVGWHQAFE